MARFTLSAVNGRRERKAAQKLLLTKSSSDGGDKVKEFRLLKRRLELYLSTLGVVVFESTDRISVTDEEKKRAESFDEFFSSRVGRPLDLIVDRFDPEKGPPTDAEEYFVFDKALDNMVAIDLLGACGDNLDYLSEVRGEHRTNRILRRIGANYYLALKTTRRLEFKRLLKLEWNPEESILDFSRKFEEQLTTCVSAGVLKNTVDQLLLFEQKVERNREGNPVVASALESVRNLADPTLSAVVKIFSSAVLNRIETGVIEFDESPPLTAATFVKSEKPKPAGKCKYCAKKHPLKKAACPAAKKTCNECGEVGHFANCCPTKKETKKRPEQVRAGATVFQSPELKAFATTAFLPENKDGRLSVGVDTCASRNCLNDLRFFEQIDLNQAGTVWLTDQKTEYSGFGVARMQFKQGGKMHRFPAYYIPGSNLNLLSNACLHRMGFKPDHDPEVLKLKLPEGGSVPMFLESDISVVKVPPPVVSVNATRVEETPELWHARTMHLGLDKLKTMRVVRKKDKIGFCDTCASCKAKKFSATIVERFRKRPTKPGEMWALDLLIPGKESRVPGALLLP